MNPVRLKGLTPDEFERLCLELVNKSLQLAGRRCGAISDPDQGIDIEATSKAGAMVELLAKLRCDATVVGNGGRRKIRVGLLLRPKMRIGVDAADKSRADFRTLGGTYVSCDITDREADPTLGRMVGARAVNDAHVME